MTPRKKHRAGNDAGPISLTVFECGNQRLGAIPHGERGDDREGAERRGGRLGYGGRADDRRRGAELLARRRRTAL
jgi:hypothetical protein